MHRSCKFSLCLDVELSNISLIDINPAFMRKLYDRRVVKFTQRDKIYKIYLFTKGVK